ncbi:MAG: DUF1553 domain-containing protein, partial [Verrucomicrobia bacterium]|nr:DUF1553 domain-containing protein [Verrucomicrobiota bacterium]
RHRLGQQWRAEVAMALGAPPPSERPAGTPALERLAQRRLADPGKDPVAALLEQMSGHPDGTAAAMDALEKDQEAATGLRFGPGRVGSGFLATGNSALERPHDAVLEPAQLTVEAWVQTASFPKDGDARRWLVNKNGNEWVEGHYALVLDRNRPGAYLNIGGGREHVAAVWSDGAVLEPDRWHHLALTYDGERLQLFVDGVPSGHAQIGRQRVPGTGPLAIGRRQDGHVAFQGQLDGIRIYGRALTPGEIAASARHPESGPVEGVVAAWDFDSPTDGERRASDQAALRDAFFGSGGILEVPSDPAPWIAAPDREILRRLAGDWERLKDSAPPPLAVALAVSEDTPVNLPVFHRGSHLSPGPDPVPRGFLRVAHRPSDPLPTPDSSGRLELARWLISPEHPLTARVIANRVWQAHFGEGLVRTSDNFGIRGEPPTHPELLDWLAQELIRSGWDLRHLHRLILNSATWRQSATPGAEPDGVAPDPDNRLLSRFPRQRLEAEMVRDALLAVSGRLDGTLGGSLVAWKNNEYTPGDEVSAASVRRSVYLPVVRDRVYDVFTLFDFANPSVGIAKRTPTVVSHQALFFMNSPLVRDCARALAMELVAGSTRDADRLTNAYERLYGRHPTGTEQVRAFQFLEGRVLEADQDPFATWTALCHALLSANEFLYRE